MEIKGSLRVPFFVFDLTFIIFHVIINYKQLGVGKIGVFQYS